MKQVLTILMFFIFTITHSQVKFKVTEHITDNYKSIYTLVDEHNKTIRILDSAKYALSFNSDDYGYFAVFWKRETRGWSAINADEKVLFEVYNTSIGEPSPDYLIENKIRIVNTEDKIGYADEKGSIIIEPQFEIATSFYNGKAIIGENCKKVPWGDHEHEDGCNHYSIVCEKQGYIDNKGRVIKLGNYTFEEIMEEINWKRSE